MDENNSTISGGMPTAAEMPEKIYAYHHLMIFRRMTKQSWEKTQKK
jgi:hypothetical protein